MVLGACKKAMSNTMKNAPKNRFVLRSKNVCFL